jgi:hypothetical protein
VQFKLVGAASEIEKGSNRDGVGARVILKSGQMQLLREVILGDGYGAQSTLRLHFGLGEHDDIDEIIVRWPRSGIEQRFENVAPNKLYEIKENQNELIEKVYRMNGAEG